MKNITELIALSLSVIVLAGGVIWAAVDRKTKKSSFKQMLHKLVVTVFLANFLCFVPLHLFEGNVFTGIGNALFSSIQWAIKIFTGDFDIEKISLLLSSMLSWKWLATVAEIYMALLSVFAPVLAVGYVFNMIARMVSHKSAEKACKKNNVYIFNELNDMSVSIAESIRTKKTEKKSVIIFTDVFEKNDEEDFELMRRVRNINAVCHKEDVVLLDEKLKRFYSKASGKKVEFFLISEDTNENVSHAIKLYEGHKENVNDVQNASRIKIYVFTPKEYDAGVIETLAPIPIKDFDYSSQLSEGKYDFAQDFDCFTEKILELHGLNKEQMGSKFAQIADKAQQKAEQKIKLSDEEKTAIALKETVNQKAIENEAAVNKAINDIKNNFSENICIIKEKFEQSLPCIVRRVDPAQRLVWKTVGNSDHCIYKSEQNLISILILGMGDYGMEFLRTLAWYYQLPSSFGASLEINIVDKNTDVEDTVLGLCSDFVRFGKEGGDGDASYKLNFFGGIDVFGYNFEKLIQTNPCLKNTTAAFVCLGDDSRDIAAAMRLRLLLSRYSNVKSAKIMAVVYDSVQAKNLEKNLVAPENVKYNIDFIGGVSTLYDYDSITLDSSSSKTEEYKDELEALKSHIIWSVYGVLKDIKQGNKLISVVDALKTYYQFEYNRKSSVATHIHDKFVDWLYENTKQEVTEDEKNAEKKPAEHARWSAYMRAVGFVHGDKKDFIAKTHPSLKHYSELDVDEQRKDEI